MLLLHHLDHFLVTYKKGADYVFCNNKLSRRKLRCRVGVDSVMKFMFLMLIVAICFPFVDKMAKRLLAHVALCTVLLVATSINMASACSCMMSHPQTHYCVADFGKSTFKQDFNNRRGQ
jgi:hypothetical protein